MEAALVLAVLAVTVALYVTQLVPIEVVSIGVIVALALLGILEPGEALSGFSSPAMITVACMLVLSAGLERAGVVDYAARLLSRGSGRGLGRLLFVIALPTIGFSAFINNTPVVVLMIPVALSLARSSSVAPSKVLIPLSYFSILGGTCTLFGTSTNILVDALYRDHGGPGFGVFEFSRLGLVYLAVGCAYVGLLAPRLLPTRQGFADLLAVQAPGRFISEVVVKAGSRHVGRELRQLFPPERDVNVLQVVRDEEALLRPPPELVVRPDDVLYVESTARSLHHLFSDPELERGTAVADEERVPLHAFLAGEFRGNPAGLLEKDESAATERVGRVDLRLAEAVVTPNSRFLGQRVRSLGLSRRHGVQVLAIRRLGRQHQYQLRDLRLTAGDVLLVQGEPGALREVHEEGDFLLVEGVERTLTFPEKAPLSLAILAGVVLLAALGVAPLVMLALAGVAVMLLTRCLDVRAAVRAIEPDVLLLLAGTIPLGLAIEKVGLAAGVAETLAGLVGTERPWLLVGALYLTTSLLTEILSNNATAVLMTPIALGIAARMGVDPKPLLIAVAFGASASFSTPIGYQTNALVMGPGGYRFRDYLRVGLPMNLLLAAVATVLIPILWSA